MTPQINLYNFFSNIHLQILMYVSFGGKGQIQLRCLEKQITENNHFTVTHENIINIKFFPARFLT